MDLRLSLTFLSIKPSANAEKSEPQFNLSCSSLTIIKLWNVRASDHCTYPRTKLTACNNTDLPRDSKPLQLAIIKVKHERNFDRLIFSLFVSSPSSSFAIVCGHSNFFTTGLFLSFAQILPSSYAYRHHHHSQIPYLNSMM